MAVSGSLETYEVISPNHIVGLSLNMTCVDISCFSKCPQNDSPVIVIGTKTKTTRSDLVYICSSGDIDPSVNQSAII